jgi:hypothetical protein
MVSRIIGVHGIGNYLGEITASEAASTISRRWSRALRGSLGDDSAIDLRVAYYAHHLVKDIAQGIDDPERLNELEQQMLLTWAHNLGAPAERPQGRLLTPGRWAADWIARHFSLDQRLVRLLVTKFCREINVYLSHDDRREAAQTEVRTAIASHDAQIVIAHSLGSVVAYEGLWADPDIKIDLLLTLGSPLAMPDVVFPRLRPAPRDGRGRRPPGVKRWINIADVGDFIAIPREFAKYFDGITGDFTAPIATFDMHKVVNYLSCTTTAAAMAGAGSW